MGNFQTIDAADFYRQLYLLLNSGLPLPESLARLSRDIGRAGLRRVVGDLARDTSEGLALSTAMRRCPQLFLSRHIRMIETGERSGRLAEVLQELGRNLQLNARMLVRLREAMLLPVFGFIFGYLIFLAVMIFVIPEIMMTMDEYVFISFAGQHYGDLIFVLVKMISEFFVAWRVPAFLLAVALAAGAFWLYSPSLRAGVMLQRFTACLPWGRSIRYYLEMARACALWSALLKAGMPLPETFRMVADTLDMTALAEAFRRLADKVESGQDLVAVAESEAALPVLLQITAATSAEAELPDELALLGDMFMERAEAAMLFAGKVWEILFTVLLALVMGMAVALILLPFRTIFNYLGA